MKKNDLATSKHQIDWLITLVPLTLIVVLCILFFCMPEQSNTVISQIRFFFRRYFRHLLFSYWLRDISPFHFYRRIPLWQYSIRKSKRKT